MSKDPAFLFYPGDYLRDTQMLSEKTQVAYDRIMCEHMRNICISQKQLMFLTKKLTEDEREELMMVLTEIPGGHQIDWVADSINKRKAYSESRRKNRTKKQPDDKDNIPETYVLHMENEIEIENINGRGKEECEKKGVKLPPYQQSFITVKADPEISIPEGFEELILTWLRYKSEKGQAYKKTCMISLKKSLVKDNSGDPVEAKRWIEHSMANNYSGIYPPKNGSPAKYATLVKDSSFD